MSLEVVLLCVCVTREPWGENGGSENLFSAASRHGYIKTDLSGYIYFFFLKTSGKNDFLAFLSDLSCQELSPHG